jgi:hypothetical protein
MTNLKLLLSEGAIMKKIQLIEMVHTDFSINYDLHLWEDGDPHLIIPMICTGPAAAQKAVDHMVTTIWNMSGEEVKQIDSTRMHY